MSSNCCPVCGYPELTDEPYAQASGSLEICPSCGIQFGYDDAAGGDIHGRIRIWRAWRIRWEQAGHIWWSSTEPPNDWNGRLQLDALVRFGDPLYAH